MSESHFRGIYLATYRVPDIASARVWYSRAFGVDPYFDEPFYVGFDIGGYELGLQPASEAGGPGPGGGVAYWGVADAETATQHLLALGAEEHQAVRDVGGGIKVATVRDPYGNLLGIVENPHFRVP